jgi:transposase
VEGEMAMVVGVDTHKDGHSAALLDELGGLLAALDVAANRSGYRQLLSWARRRSEVRTWVVEGTGSYGAGLAAFLAAEGEVVFEGDRPQRRVHGGAGKSDQLDAIRVAREALARPHHAQPRRRGEREAIRVLLTARAGAVDAHSRALNQLYALVVTAPEPLRDRLNNLKGDRLLAACQRLRCSGDLETATTAQTLRRVGRRVFELAAEAADYQRQLSALLTACAAPLLAQTGVGPITAAQLLISWSHAGRLRNEGAFAALAGVAPIPASSGRTIRYRLNHFGDRQLNRALHVVALTRGRIDPATRQYIARRTAEGKSPREIRRCLKRYLARRLFKILQRLDMT